jgi:hypothetical protein
MDKKELKNLVKENFDTALIGGTCEFSDRIPDLEGLVFETTPSMMGGLLTVRLKWKSGYMALHAKEFTRAQMISKFTDFLWMYLNS